jgi:hypothetical protein
VSNAAGDTSAMADIRVVNTLPIMGLHIAVAIVSFRCQEGMVDLLGQGHVRFNRLFWHGGFLAF